MVISTSLQACGVVFPFAIPTSICRSNVTICSALYLLIDMTSLPPRKRFSLTSAGTKIPGQVSAPPSKDKLSYVGRYRNWTEFKASAASSPNFDSGRGGHGAHFRIEQDLESFLCTSKRKPLP